MSISYSLWHDRWTTAHGLAAATPTTREQWLDASAQLKEALMATPALTPEQTLDFAGDLSKLSSGTLLSLLAFGEFPSEQAQPALRGAVRARLMGSGRSDLLAQLATADHSVSFRLLQLAATLDPPSETMWRDILPLVSKPEHTPYVMSFVYNTIKHLTPQMLDDVLLLIPRPIVDSILEQAAGAGHHLWAASILADPSRAPISTIAPRMKILEAMAPDTPMRHIADLLAHVDVSDPRLGPMVWKNIVHDIPRWDDTRWAEWLATIGPGAHWGLKVLPSSLSNLAAPNKAAVRARIADLAAQSSVLQIAEALNGLRPAAADVVVDTLSDEQRTGLVQHLRPRRFSPALKLWAERNQLEQATANTPKAVRALKM